jgi:hypothetical protein
MKNLNFMKKYIFILFSVLFLLPACNDRLDLRTNGSISMDEVFTNRNLTRGYLNACYGYLPSTSVNIGSYTDDAVNSGEVDAGSTYDYWYVQGMDASNFASHNWEGSVWGQYFQGIRKCNVFLENVDNAAAYSDTERAGWKAQALTLRAFYYLQLIKRYGPVPIFTTDLGTSHDYSQDTRSSVGDVVTQILADCDAAIATEDSDDFSWYAITNQWEIMTKAVAYAIESEAVTLAVSPLWESDGVITMEQAQEVTATALSELLQHDFSLWTEASGDYNAYANYFLNTPNDLRASDKETIWGGFQVAIWGSSGLPIVSGQTSAGNCPTQELVDAYETTDGEPVLDLENPYNDEQHLEPNYNSENTLYDPDNPFENRDPRFYATVFYNGSTRGDEVINTQPGGNCAINSTSKRYTHTGYYMRKYASDASNRNSNSDGYVRIIRLPAMYFNFAEIAYQVSGPDITVSTDGLNMSAREAVNAVRARVGMPEIPSGLSASEFEARYRNERRVEFALEDDRFFSLRRWKEISVTRYLTGANVNDDGSLERFSFEARPSADDKYLLYPIDQSEENKTLELTGTGWQNPGW